MSKAASAMRPPAISRVGDKIPRPRWSVMVPTYNCAHQTGDTLASVVAQGLAPEEMEIVVVDDASTDNIRQVATAFGDRISFYTQPENLGVPHNLTAAIRLSRGHIVHILHGDDQVLPGFYSAMDQAFSDPEIGAAYCRQIFMNQDGEHIGMSPLERETGGRLADAVTFLALEQRIMTPSICVRRSVYERLGGFHPALACAEDWEMWVRIARHYPISYIPEALALYRMQQSSNTGRNVRSARDVLFNGVAIDLIRAHLPAETAEATVRQARRTYARSALATARNFARTRDMSAALAQIRGAFRLNRSTSTLISCLHALLDVVRLFRRGAQVR